MHGQFGVKAKIDIQANTHLGPFIGKVRNRKNFKRDLENTSEGLQMLTYSWTVEFSGKGNYKEKYKQNTSLVIDSLSMDRMFLLGLINDCRKTIEERVTLEELSSEDEERRNMVFDEVAINGMPSIWARVDKDVKKGDVILGFYGAHYFDAVENINYFREKGNAIQQKFKEIVQEIDPMKPIDVEEIMADE